MNIFKEKRYNKLQKLLYDIDYTLTRYHECDECIIFSILCYSKDNLCDCGYYKCPSEYCIEIDKVNKTITGFYYKTSYEHKKLKVAVYPTISDEDCTLIKHITNKFINNKTKIDDDELEYIRKTLIDITNSKIDFDILHPNYNQYLIGIRSLYLDKKLTLNEVKMFIYGYTRGFKRLLPAIFITTK